VVPRREPIEPTTVAGGLLRLARHQTGLTQRQLAALAGVPQSMIAAYETGRREPSMPTLLKLINAAGLDLRMELVTLDNHDQVLANMAEHWPADKRQRWDRYQEWILARNRAALRR
jgi:transcriptional regulator with XRE-family HTH domain